MLALDLPIDIEERLETVASQAGRTKEAWVADAIVELLKEQEDHLVAIERLRRGRPGIPLEEVERQLGLAS
jgi:RHH-type rel operon transcriptional repressor/antitoxin RelB